MASDKVEVYQISQSDQINNKENVILRAISSDPKRHKPLLNHPPPTSAADQAAIPASMYTLETRYQPIPYKVLPKSKEPRVYYIEPKKEEQVLVQSAEMPKDETSLPTEEERAQTIILEPKVVSQPVLYSIIGAKSLPPQIADQTFQPTAKINQPTLNVPPPAPETSPVLYSLVANPRLKVQIQEPVKDAPDIPLQAPPTLYTVIGNPHVQQPIAEPARTAPPLPPSIPKQTPPVLYSIVANPKLISDIPHTITSDPPPVTQPIKNSSLQPTPILYTIVGETKLPNNISKINRVPLAPIKRQANVAIINDSNDTQSTTISRKTQPLSPPKHPQQLPPISAPLLFSIVGSPNLSLSDKNSSVQKKTVPKPIGFNRRVSRSLDRQTAPESRTKHVTDIPPLKHKHYRKLQEPTIPKSETIFYPLSDHERSPHLRQRRTSPGQIRNGQFQIPSYDPLQLPDYISPYAYHPVKPYREQTIHPSTLPIIKNRYSYKSRMPPYELDHRDQQKSPYDLWKAHSSERYPAKSRENHRLWDYEHEAHSDDGDDVDGLQSHRKRGRYHHKRQRIPWEPVW